VRNSLDVYHVTKAPQAPTRASVLQQLTQIQEPINARQDRVLPNGQAAAALWINDGLELEDEQYVSHKHPPFIVLILLQAITTHSRVYNHGWIH